MTATTYKPMDAYEKQIIEQQYRKVWGNDEKMVKHYVSTTSNFFTSDEGIIIPFGKPHIVTRFWIPEHGYDYNEAFNTAIACENDVQYFIYKNMSNLETYSNAWNGGLCDCYNHPYIKHGKYIDQSADCALGKIEWADRNGNGCYKWSYDLPSKGYRKLTDKEIDRLHDAENRRNALFEKRLCSYLKRYGLSKVSCGTYWADR